MAMRTLSEIIHFKGSEANWKAHIANGDWANNIVFGLVTDETGLVSKRTFNGRDSRGNDYAYNSAITVNSLEHANALATNYNIGLIINVINENENGTYIVNYDDGEPSLVNVKNEWNDEIEIPQDAGLPD